jgi:DNA-binding MarR family transcriptional regulator
VGHIGFTRPGLDTGRLLDFATVNQVNVSTVNEVELANRLRPALLTLARELRREIHSLGVTGGQVSLLVAVKYAPGIGVRELAEQERISKAAVSKAITKLEQMGLVERQEVQDKRRVGLKVSEKGHQVLRSVRSRRTIWLAERLKGLSPEELARVEAAIEPLEKLLR